MGRTVVEIMRSKANDLSIKQANTQCPSTKIVISGYSQGGQLVHNAAKKLESNQAAVDQVAAGEFFLEYIY